MRLAGQDCIVPSTRWAFPPPWLDVTRSGPPGHAAFQAPEGGGGHCLAGLRARTTEDALVALLERDLRQGHRQVAIRHFTMLQLLRADVPASLQLECQRLVRRCEPSVLARTVRRVDEWAAMLKR